jgi:hypothetical protein
MSELLGWATERGGSQLLHGMSWTGIGARLFVIDIGGSVVEKRNMKQCRRQCIFQCLLQIFGHRPHQAKIQAPTKTQIRRRHNLHMYNWENVSQTQHPHEMAYFGYAKVAYHVCSLPFPSQKKVTANLHRWAGQACIEHLKWRNQVVGKTRTR